MLDQTRIAPAQIRAPWFVAMVLMMLFIWGNSLVPGSESGSLSLSVVQAVRHALEMLGMPNDWVTNFLVRKAAHFTEYAVLGVLATNAFGLCRRVQPWQVLAVCLVLVLTPSIDETIQLFVSGRSGQLPDVLLDCCGGVTGAVVAALIRTRRAL